MPAMAVAGTFTHQPTGSAAALPPIRIAPMPVPVAVSYTMDGLGAAGAVVIATG
jgi:hypothetical protein